MTNLQRVAASDAAYLKIVLDPIYVCAQYRSKFGQGAKGGGLTLSQFQTLYRGDSFYNWFGLDNPLMYAAHKAAGGMTSIYRQIGIGCEALFRRILQDTLGLSDSDVRWSYEIPTPGGKTRTLYLDGRVPLAAIKDSSARQRFHGWMAESATSVGVDERVFQTLTGTVFEVRQGYKSMDSKRQNADIANATNAYVHFYLPVIALMSLQIDEVLVTRYTASRWLILRGRKGGTPFDSTYAFCREVVGYDLAAFFERNSPRIRAVLEDVLKNLMESK